MSRNRHPSRNGDSGRGKGGRFTKGNSLGSGNPYAKQTAALCAVLMSAITPDDIKDVVDTLIKNAKAGDIQHIRELLMRAVGKYQDPDYDQRLERLEKLLGTTMAALASDEDVSDAIE